MFRCGRQTKKRKINRHFGLRPRIGRGNFAFTCTEFWFTNSIFHKNFKWKLISHKIRHIFSRFDYFGLGWVYIWYRSNISHSCEAVFPNPDLFTSGAHTIAHGKTYRRLCLSVCLTPNAWKHQLFLIRFVSFACLNCTNRNQYTRNVMHQYMCPHRTTIFYSVFVFSFSHKEETRENSTHSATTPAYCVSPRRLYNNEWLRLTVDVRTSHHHADTHTVWHTEMSVCSLASIAAPSTVWWK